MINQLQRHLRTVAWALVAGAAFLASVPDALAEAPAARVAPGFAGLTAQDRVALLPIDVELFSLSGGGVAEPKADWTAAALAHLNAALDAKRRALGLDFVPLSETDADGFSEQIGLHAAVAHAVAMHHVEGGIWALPSKGGRLEWNFGDAMAGLHTKTGARYGLFIWVRDSYASAERKAAMIGLALLGIGVGGGVQIGYASLVDLSSGQLVWFNRLARVRGDLREAAPAAESLEALLAGFPVSR